MDEKKNSNQGQELRDEELDNVSGGAGLPPGSYHWFGVANYHVNCTCWWCGKEYSYSPGLNQTDLDDPWRHFCSEEHKLAFEEANNMIDHERT